MEFRADKFWPVGSFIVIVVSLFIGAMAWYIPNSDMNGVSFYDRLITSFQPWHLIVAFIILLEIIFVIWLFSNKKQKGVSWLEHTTAIKFCSLSVAVVIFAFIPSLEALLGSLMAILIIFGWIVAEQ